MISRARVAIVRTQPDTVRLCELSGMRQALDPSVITILKDNISWHFPMPDANTILTTQRCHPVTTRSLLR